jgi:mannosyltransferase
MATTEVQIPIRPVSARRRTPVATGLIPAVVMTALGLWGLWGDEAATWSAARRSPAELWRLLGDVDAVHGLYYLLMHGLLQLRADEVMLRLPSVVAMSCAAALVAAIGARLAGPRVGVAAGTLFAVVPVVSLYAQEGRSYALVTACAVAATYCLVRGCESGRQGWWQLYTLCAGLAGLLNPFAVLVLVAHAVTLLMARSGAREWRRWSVTAVVAVVLVAPVAWLARGQGEAATTWITAPGWEAVIRLVRSFAGPSGWVSRLLLLLAAAALLVPRRPALKSHMLPVPRLTVVKVALPLLVVPPALLIAVSQVQPVYDQRYVLYALPGLPLLAALGDAGGGGAGRVLGVQRADGGPSVHPLPGEQAGRPAADRAAGGAGDETGRRGAVPRRRPPQGRHRRFPGLRRAARCGAGSAPDHRTGRTGKHVTGGPRVGAT